MAIEGNALGQWDIEVDVVVVGYGGAGAATAITAHDSGARVLVLEKHPADGRDDGGLPVVRHTPSTRMSGGLIWIAESADKALLYQKSLNEVNGTIDVPDDMLRVWAEGLTQVYPWLQHLAGGDRFVIAKKTADFPEFPGAEAVDYAVNSKSGYGFFECLDLNVKDRNVQVMYGTPAVELIQRPGHKEVVGVIGRDANTKRDVAIKARRGVVLTCGGFEYNFDMQASFLTMWPAHFYGNPGNTGDGIKMAMKAGAALWHMNIMTRNLHFWFSNHPISFSRRPSRIGSAIIVDKYGKRFCDENAKSEALYWEAIRADPRTWDYPRIPAHYIFDERTRLDGPLASGSLIPFSWRSESAAAMSAAVNAHHYDWSVDNTKEIANGWITRAETLEDLAGRIGVDAQGLCDTVRLWNQQCADGNDPDFGRNPSSMAPIISPPFYQAPLYPGGGATSGGPKRDKDARVLDLDDRPIPRLYSSGELGSICSLRYQHGGHLSESIVFGRIAGSNAAAEQDWDGQ